MNLSRKNLSQKNSRNLSQNFYWAAPRKGALDVKRILSVNDLPDEENMPREPWNLTRRFVPEIRYNHTETDAYDGIIFLMGHSEFKGDEGILCHNDMNPGMKQHTLLVANLQNNCVWFTDPDKFKDFIRSRFRDALSYVPTNIGNFLETVKSKMSKLKGVAKIMETNLDYQRFFASRIKSSLHPDEYCQRQWQFYKQDGDPIPDGGVMLLRRGKNGKPYFTPLYEDMISTGKFSLLKSQLYDKLYAEPYHLRNVLLVDFGCTNLKDVDPMELKKLIQGRI